MVANGTVVFWRRLFKSVSWRVYILHFFSKTLHLHIYRGKGYADSNYGKTDVEPNTHLVVTLGHATNTLSTEQINANKQEGS